MQSDVELGLGDNEQILAIGYKNQIYFICATILFVVVIVALLFSLFVISSNYLSFSKCFYFVLIVFFSWLTKVFYDSYQYNQVYITNKRIIITQKDRIEGIPFEEVQYFNTADLDISTLNLKSKRKIVFAYTNLDDVKNEFIKLYPNYKQPKITLRQIIAISLAIAVVVFFKMPEEYMIKIQHKLLPEYDRIEKSIEVTDAKSYMTYMQKTLKLHWTPPKLENDASVVVEFKIKPDGTIFDEKVVETSGSREMDNSALFALRNANPLRKLPVDLQKEKDVKINFTFDYNVKKDNDLTVD